MDKPQINHAPWEYLSRISRVDTAAVHSRPTVTSRHWKAVGRYTLAFFSAPVCIASNIPVFNAFTQFHSRLLNLKTKGPVGLFGCALMMSMIYSSLVIPVYYKGALLVLGIKELRDLSGAMTDTILLNFEHVAPLVQKSGEDSPS
jgi:hypothetical protein